MDKYQPILLSINIVNPDPISSPKRCLQTLIIVMSPVLRRTNCLLLHDLLPFFAAQFLFSHAHLDGNEAFWLKLLHEDHFWPDFSGQKMGVPGSHWSLPGLS